MLLRRFALEQSHLQPLVLGPAILEPELHVLRLQTRKLLAIGHLVQFLRVRQNELRTDHKNCFQRISRQVGGKNGISNMATFNRRRSHLEEEIPNEKILIID